MAEVARGFERLRGEVMKKLFFLIAVSLGLAGCNKSNVGSYPERETGTNSEITVNRPRITAPPAATNKPVSVNASKGAINANSIAEPEPTNQERTRPADTTNGAPPAANSSSNEQGNQSTREEPKTDDDPNPDG